MRVKLNIFFLNFFWILKLVNFKICDQFSYSSFEKLRFSSFNQILLRLFEVSHAFQTCIWVVYIIWHIFTLMLNQILLWKVLEMSNKLNKI